MSSSAQPVKGTAPAIPVAFCTGVSTDPNGAVDVACRRSVTAMLLEGTLAPVNVMVTAPVNVPTAGRPPLGVTLTVSVALPDPDAGVTTSQGCEGVAVHVTAPAPLWVTRTG